MAVRSTSSPCPRFLSGGGGRRRWGPKRLYLQGGSSNTSKVRHARCAALSSGFGVSTASSTPTAVKTAVESALAMSGEVNGAQTLAIVSTTVSRDVDEVREAFVNELPPGTKIHGLTSSGGILSSTSGGVASGGVGCLLLSTEEEKGVPPFACTYGEKAAEVVAELAGKMPEPPQMILMAGTPGAEEGVLTLLDEVFPGVPVFGGTAADDALTGDWKVFSRTGSSGEGVSLVGFASTVSIGASMLGPYSPTEKKCVATKSEGRRVFEINGGSAKEWVYEWLGEEVQDQYEEGGLILAQTAKSPVGMKVTNGEYITAHLAALGGANETFVDFFAPVPPGTELVVMDAGKGPETGYGDALIAAFDKAAEEVDDEIKAGLLIFCGGMAIAVGDSLEKGLTSRSLQNRVAGIPLMGMTCFGEQNQIGGTNVQRNLSVGMLLFG